MNDNSHRSMLISALLISLASSLSASTVVSFSIMNHEMLASNYPGYLPQQSSNRLVIDDSWDNVGSQNRCTTTVNLVLGVNGPVYGGGFTSGQIIYEYYGNELTAVVDDFDPLGEAFYIKTIYLGYFTQGSGESLNFERYSGYGYFLGPQAAIPGPGYCLGSGWSY